MIRFERANILQQKIRSSFDKKPDANIELPNNDSVIFSLFVQKVSLIQRAIGMAPEPKMASKSLKNGFQCLTSSLQEP